MAGKPTSVFDIAIDGCGFYQIAGLTRAGKRFMRRVQGTDPGGVAYSDDSRMTQDIADGAIADDLRVEVNGREYPY